MKVEDYVMYRAEEDYIKNIYKLTVEQNRDIVKNIEVAEIMESTDQTVNEMVRRLASKRLVTFIPYKGVNLTEKGLKEAVRLVRNHRLWEKYLVEKLNYPWSKVHEEAERLEHASSEDLMAQIYKALGNPLVCAHGNPIPGVEKPIGYDEQISLSSAQINHKFLIKRVVDQKKLLEFLDRHKLNLGVEVEIIKNDKFTKLMTIEYENRRLDLTAIITDKIYGILV
ncbi:MAG: metal-dependent transcriptional regulator [Acholeplasma sp.]